MPARDPIKAEAERCRNLTLRDRMAGEQAFGQLIKAHPDDGMVYLMRGEAYEALEEYQLASGDYRKARVLLPWLRWQQQAQLGIERTKIEVRAAEEAAANDVGSCVTELGHRELGDVFDGLLALLGQIDPDHNGEDMSNRIPRLSRSGLVPRKVATNMNYLRIQRNLAVKEQERFVGAEAESIMSAWTAVKEWAQRAGHRTERPT